ncbi:MAG: SdpI family protein [Crocinitomicaceae bacterium]|nr:SdpI family protein [Crocinitomicaceae bacterium]
MKNFKLLNEIAFVMAHLTPFVYLFMMYDSMPETVPTHFNIDGEADGFSSKSNLVWMLLALNGIGYLLFLLIPLIDPKKLAEKQPKIYNRIRIGMTLLLAGLSVLMIYMTTGSALKGIFALGIFFCMICIFLGNYIQAVKPNYFIGFRTPWTLNSEDNWKRTHLLSGRILFYGGLLSVPVLFLMPENLAPFPPVIVLVVGSLIGVVYSYTIFRKQKKEII